MISAVKIIHSIYRRIIHSNKNIAEFVGPELQHSVLECHMGTVTSGIVCEGFN